MPLRNSALKQWDRRFPSLERRQLISGKRFFRSVGVNLLWVVLSLLLPGRDDQAE